VETTVRAITEEFDRVGPILANVSRELQSTSA